MILILSALALFAAFAPPRTPAGNAAADETNYVFSLPTENFDPLTEPYYDGEPIEPGVDFVITDFSGNETDYSMMSFAFAPVTDGVAGDIQPGLPENAGDYVIYVTVPEIGGVPETTLTADYKIYRAYGGFPGLSGFMFTGVYGETLQQIIDRTPLPEFENGYLTVAPTFPGDTVYPAGENFIRLLFDIDDPNYFDLNITCKLIIEKVDYDMSGVIFSDAEFTYDGNAKSIFVSGSVPEGLQVIYSGNDAVEVGSHTVTATFLPDGNHNAPESMTAVITIVAAPEKQLSGGEIAGIAIGCVAALIIAAYLSAGIAVYKKKITNKKMTRLYPFIKADKTAASDNSLQINENGEKTENLDAEKVGTEDSDKSGDYDKSEDAPETDKDVK